MRTIMRRKLEVCLYLIIIGLYPLPECWNINQIYYVYPPFGNPFGHCLNLRFYEYIFLLMGFVVTVVKRMRNIIWIRLKMLKFLFKESYLITVDHCDVINAWFYLYRDFVFTVVKTSIFGRIHTASPKGHWWLRL